MLLRSTTVAPSATPFATRLAGFGDQVAIVTAEVQLSYRELSERVEAIAQRLGGQRRLVLVAGGNRIDTLVAYLAALSGGHPVLLAAGSDPERLESLIATYDFDVVMREVAGEWCLQERRLGSAHQLHPDLALLLSTSGSTGSPRLVRLSHDNLQSNADAIATYLDIRPTDRAATTLPMSYCYGLSVVNSHLARGAALILTDLSVVDACLWDLFRDHQGTSFAGVPYTFELLDKVGFAERRLPSLRYVTQAGGRLSPDKVERFARLGARDGWDFFVMYGQTEATARMAYLPPQLAATHPSSIGVPVPGGSFTLEPVGGISEPDAGELVYSGPNVMMGYADGPVDLCLGRTIEKLRTGDIARLGSNGLFEVIGRRSRFAKLFGLRIDLQQVETELVAEGVSACCLEAGDELVVAVEGRHRSDELRSLVARRCGLPICAARICPFDRLPRLENGKPDYQKLAQLTQVRSGGPPEPSPRPLATASAHDDMRPLRVEVTTLCDLFAEVLGRRATPGNSFVSLEGDSLSYVEMSVRLEECLGQLPGNWHLTPICDLATSRRRRPWVGWRSIETNVLLRAAAIVAIVGSHANVFTLLGGAHVLLAIAGFNFARFQLTTSTRRERMRHQLGSIGRIAVPSVVGISLAYALTDHYSVANIFLLNGIVGPDNWTTQWHFWFVEVLVYILAAVTAGLAIPAVDRFERRFGFEIAMAALALGLLWRYDVILLDTGPDRIHTAHLVFWLFAVGWATAKASRQWQRLLVTLLALSALPGFFGDAGRETLVAVGLCLLVWVPTMRVPEPSIRVVSVLASSSLHIYLVHWLVYPHWENSYPLFALAASLVAGIAFWVVAMPVMTRLESLVIAHLLGATPHRPSTAPESTVNGRP
ncbi:MAG: AMP-binding protein [Nocardioidaceae bacterium]|nr:AMP-binding protein [Nocardioidaceae bacterium]